MLMWILRFGIALGVVFTGALVFLFLRFGPPPPSLMVPVAFGWVVIIGIIAYMTYTFWPLAKRLQQEERPELKNNKEED